MKLSIPCLFLLASAFQPTPILCAGVASEATASDPPRHLRTGKQAKEQEDRELLIFCPHGNDWGDGTEVAGISEGCCRSCSEPPNVCATHWPSNGLYRCGVDPFHGWPDGTLVAPGTGWRCANGWSYRASSNDFRCGKDADHCWAEGLYGFGETRTGCCYAPAHESGAVWVCGNADEDPAIFCSGNLKEHCQT